MTIRSAKLYSGLPAAASNVTAFTVPAGFVYLVKDAHAWNAGPLADTVDSWLQDAAGHVVNIWWNQSLAVGGILDWANSVALEVGDLVVVRSQQGTTRFWLSGAKLTA